jgi:hypothetical protein
MGYAKLFSSITESSLWSEPKEVRLLFVTMLAKADAGGFIEASALGLARVANLSISEVEAGLTALENPDPHSKNPDNDGRRIMKVPGGWAVLNYEQYRNRQSEEERREYMREYMRNYRSVNSQLTPVNKSKESPSASASASALLTKSRCSQKEAEDFCESLGLPRSDGEAMFLHWEERGWKGVRDWKATIRKWKSFSYLPSLKTRKTGAAAVKAEKAKGEFPSNVNLSAIISEP